MNAPINRNQIAAEILAALLANGQFTRIETGRLAVVREQLGPQFRDLKDDRGRSLMVREDPAVAILIALDLTSELIQTMEAAGFTAEISAKTTFADRVRRFFGLKPKTQKEKL